MKFAGLATVPARAHALERVVESLLPQVDKLGVALNGYTDVPAFLAHPRIDVIQNACDKRDLAKFHWQPSWEGHYFSCDDDLVYPPWYVEHMYRELEDRDAMRSIVTMHGYDGECIRKRTVYPCLDRVVASREVLVGGTGAMLHFAPALRLDDPYDNDRADMWIARLAHSQGLRIFVLAHEADTLEYLPPDDGTTLWDESVRDGHKHYDALLKTVRDARDRRNSHREPSRVHAVALRTVPKANAR